MSGDIIPCPPDMLPSGGCARFVFEILLPAVDNKSAPV